MYNTHEEWQLALQAPFAIEEIRQRPMVIRKDKSAAIPANYIDARTVMARLDAVAGPFNWQVRYEEIKGVIYAQLGLRCPDSGDWVWKADAGSESNQEAAKGEASDAFKRAAVRFGVGRHLYAIPEKWVDGYRRKDGKFAFDSEALEEYRNWLAKWMQRYQQPAISDGSANGNGASPSGATVQDTTPPDEEHLEEIRKEKNRRTNQREAFRKQLERAQDSFQEIGEERKFEYQLRKAYDTTSIDKIVQEHWQDEAGVLDALRDVFTNEKAA